MSEKLSGWQIMDALGIDYFTGYDYEVPFTPPEPTPDQLQLELFADLTEEKKLQIFYWLHQEANSLRGNAWDYGNVGISQTSLNESYRIDLDHVGEGFYAKKAAFLDQRKA